MKTLKFVRKPFLVDGVQVTEENMHEVAAWCQSEVRMTRPKSPSGTGKPYVKVRIFRPLNEKQTMAFPGDWVLYAGNGYKVYNDRAFQATFEQAPGGDEKYMVVHMDEHVVPEPPVVNKPEVPEYVRFESAPEDEELGVYQESLSSTTGSHNTI